MSRKSIRKTIT